MKSLLNLWKDLSVSKKLYGVVGVMLLLITTELLTLRFAMGTLSSVRAFVGGEGLWSKAQKEAVLNLQKFALTHDERYYQDYLNNLKVSLGDRQARLELQKLSFDYQTVYDGFVGGHVHPQDIEGMIRLLRRFHWVSYIHEAIVQWTEGDRLIQSLQVEAERLRALIRRHPTGYSAINTQFEKIYAIDHDLTPIEDNFSYVLGEGSRWLESVLMTILLLAVLTVESTGVILTISFSRHLSRELKELNTIAGQVGQGNFEITAPVRSKDELGQLAGSLNKMIADLKHNVGEKELAENASQVKNLFLANMSHEIRTPLGSILGFTELLKEPDLPPEERRRYVDIIERTGRGLTKIINDILDISKIEAGHLEIEKSVFSLKNLLSDLHQALALRSQERGIELKFAPVGSPPDFIYSDPTRLRQILTNLLGNAVKFTERGLVVLEYGVKGNNLHFKVTDTGPGIPQNKIRELFRPFSQVDPSASRKHEGTGLGLVLSKRLARALGGDVTLAQTSTQGSTFSATVLFETPPHQPRLRLATSPGRATLRGMRVLLVEDVPENQLLIKLILERGGAQVTIAANGAEALEQNGLEDFDVILMDMQMPVMDGYEATQRIRERGINVPIIALTAHAMAEDRNRSLSAGCNDYLTKPIQVTELIDRLSRFVKVTPPAGERPPELSV